jgi:hypothetical protein
VRYSIEVKWNDDPDPHPYDWRYDDVVPEFDIVWDLAGSTPEIVLHPREGRIFSSIREFRMLCGGAMPVY